MAPVESADPHGESDVVALLTAIEFELLSRGLAGGAYVPAAISVAADSVSWVIALAERSTASTWPGGPTRAATSRAGRTRAAADLDHSEAGLKRQRIDDHAQSR